MLDPVPVGDAALVPDQFSLQVELARTEVASGRPGEIGGEALAVTVQIRHEGATSRDVSTVSVTVDDADGIPLSPLYGEPYSPLDGDLEPGGSTEGTYVFTLADVTPPYTVRVSAAAEDPAAVFVGSL
ncbi:hypothetical protein [Ornithinimicrobium sufpigmenti]|uniref:hypothetical protein n=1 Tax=Ornithinimicrobium sufpigmenti TaxID=2508882 RepID=UPI00103613CD|nr:MULTISPECIES: hypothetical protein [unclassified Ornithinimicrobium]